MKNWVSKIASLTVGGGLALAAGTISASATTVFTDGDFNNFSVTPIFQSGIGTVTVQQCTTCGTGSGLGLGILVDLTGSAGSPTDSVGAIENAFSYDPTTQGAITSIDASVDKDVIIAAPQAGSYLSSFHPLILQDGNYYMATIAIGTFPSPGDTGYISSSQTGLTAADFALYSFVTGITTSASHPDFAGSAMQFGLATITQLTPGTVANINFDNLRLQVNSAALATTPIPGSLPLLATGLVGMGLVARRRHKQSA